MTPYVAYYRVSTQGQGRSGLGLEAQMRAVKEFARGDAIIMQFTEVESGRNDDRPELMNALAYCRATKATLLIAKLDRLARDVAFIANLMKNGVEFRACDMPQANALTVHIMAAFAEHEAKAISERTKAALASAKARGVKLGGDRGQSFSADQRALGHAANKRRVAEHDASVMKEIERIRGEAGDVSLGVLARVLNSKGYLTLMNGDWSPTAVKRVLDRAKEKPR
jgi:DNA invertase Pin-like site-specific DNA recombinase